MRIFFILLIFIFVSIIVAIESSFPIVTIGNLYRNFSQHKNLAIVLKIKKNISNTIGGLLIYDNIFASLLIMTSIDFFSEKLGMQFKPYISILVPILITLWEAIIKAYVMRDSARISIYLAPLTSFLFMIVKPFSIIFEKFAHFLAEKLLPHLNQKQEEHVSFQEAKSAFEFHHSIFPSEETAMVKNLFSLGVRPVEQIMVHRRDFEQIELKTIKNILKNLEHYSHEKILVWEKNADNILGVISRFDLLETIHKNATLNEKEILNKIRFKIKSVVYMPESIPIANLLQNFREKGAGIYIVVNEYGAVLGMVTPQDVLTSIVGEFDNFEKIHVRKTDKGVIVPGETPISELNRIMFWNLEDDYTNVADLILSVMKDFPDSNSEGCIDNISFKVLKCDKQRIQFVYMEKTSQEKKEEN